MALVPSRRQVCAAGLAAAAAAGAVFGIARPAAVVPQQASAPPAFSKDTLPKEASIFRVVESKRRNDLPDELLPKWFGKHPCPTEEEELSEEVPGGVAQPTKREKSLRARLVRGEKPLPEEFDATIQVFAQRARQDVKWFPVQQREFVRRAKNWAKEMLIQEMEPSAVSLKLILLACASTGDSMGARWWFNWMKENFKPIERLEYNAIIRAFGYDGLPHDARKWMETMREAGYTPDAASYLGIVEGWERVGNRHAMLKTIQEMQDAKARDELAPPLDPRDEALPYYPLALSYAKVGDAPRAISILKNLQVKGYELTHEAHRIRLEAHLQASPQRRSVQEIVKAINDLIISKPGPVISPKLRKLCRQTLGNDQFQAVLDEIGVDESEVVGNPPGSAELHRRAKIQAALKKNPSGIRSILGHSEDAGWMSKRMALRKEAKMGEVAGGYRVAGENGLPEWMTIPRPEKFG